MGDVADMMLDGTLCEGCGVFLNDDPPGFPCYCADCKAGEKKAKTATNQQPKPKVKCEVCGRKVKAAGLNDHMRDAHQKTGAEEKNAADMEKTLQAILKTAEESEFKAVGLPYLREVIGPFLPKKGAA